ncbi:hypothetical protein jhhlp_000648 [Lomentospora prolificans]|uniref:Cytochrome P450 n=1 Tax=Lomentospora prolificans TaxID=41688 RepID=A0A2N3NJB6_9PEZI|nr:hypothetical protein jhhlp_000648 [Lomentospora prolificans]
MDPIPQTDPTKMAEASVLDTMRVMNTVVAPTLAKGVIKRRPSVEALAQHRALDTKAIELLQDLRHKYGNGPLYLRFPFRSQVLLLDPEHVAQVLAETPAPFTSATKEKVSALEHLEPENVLISSPARRDELRPVHEYALATDKRVHPLAGHFKDIIRTEAESLLPNAGQDGETTMDWDKFAQAWFKVVRRIVLGDAAREDESLSGDLSAIRGRGNWGFAASANKSKLESFQKKLGQYLQNSEDGSLVSRLPKNSELDLESQVAHWLFAFDPAGMVTFRALALLGCQPEQQKEAIKEADDISAGEDHPFTRSVFLEAVRLWPTTPVILRELTEDSDIGGFTVEKGTGVIIFEPFFHRDSERLNFAHHMSPENWARGDAVLGSGLVPFSAGPAMCPAHNLVPLVGSLMMDELLSKATIDLVEPSLDPESLPGTLDHFEVKLRLSPRGVAVA